MNNFYQEYVLADEDLDMKAVCEKYGKDYKKARQALNTAMKKHMMSSSNSREWFQELIIEELKKKGL